MEAGMMKNTDNNTWILNYYYFDCRWCSFNGCERRASVIDKSLLFLIQLSARIYVENVNLNAPSERIRESGIPTHFATSLESILSPGIFFQFYGRGIWVVERQRHWLRDSLLSRTDTSSPVWFLQTFSSTARNRMKLQNLINLNYVWREKWNP